MRPFRSRTPRAGIIASPARLALFALFGVLALAAAPRARAQRTTVDLSGSGWRLWRDAAARWKDDPLFLPPVDVAKLPVNPPTGGWGALDSAGMPVSVPGTAEEYLGHGNGPKDDVQGVTWWWRPLSIPAASTPKRLLLHFEAVRLRAEVYLDDRLVGYDLVGNTPFDVDLTPYARPGRTYRLAVRVTDPGGNFAWEDFESFGWGKYRIPASHGFGGISGRVWLRSLDPVSIDDIYVMNRPDPHTAEARVTVRNAGNGPARGDVTVRVTPKGGGAAVFEATMRDVALAPGETTVTVPVSAPQAKLWDLDHPNLYVCRASLRAGSSEDADTRTFGFRWFTASGIGKDAMFRLNGKRIVLRSAISWGFWPVNGLFPTPQLARKQVQTAKELGLTMLNFHRTIGQPIVLDEADRQGLLYYEEPGGYGSYEPGGKVYSRVRDPFMAALSREKLLRMVKRDRSHPSLVIVNMINETVDAPTAVEKTDMRDAHTLDPSRIITYSTGWTLRDKDQPQKLFMLPFDTEQRTFGWVDAHAAGGPELYYDSFYGGPDKIIKGTGGNLAGLTTPKEICFWGEEGAISTPPRLGTIAKAIQKQPRLGWDGAVYRNWDKTFEDFLDRKGLRPYFPTVDSLTTAMGAVAHYYQGRITENVRIQDQTDGYVTNGWESEIMENYSGIVDCYRNPKADPSLMAYYNQPLYVAVKARDKVAQIPDDVVVDFWIVNERDVRGPHTLDVALRDPSGRSVWRESVPVSVTGGDVYGQLLKEGVRVPIRGGTGMFTVTARLVDPQGHLRATGHDDVLAVDWKSEKISGRGAIYEKEGRIHRFLKDGKGLDVPAYAPDMGKLDWIVLAGPHETKDLPGDPIPPDRVTGPNGAGHGFRATFFRGTDLKRPAGERTDAQIEYPDSVPTPEGLGPEDFSARWEGQVIPPSTGTYEFRTIADDGVRLWVNGKLMIDDWNEAAPRLDSGAIDLRAGVPASIRLEYFQAGGGSALQLRWLLPNAPLIDAGKVWDRVRDDGTTAVVVDYTASWMQSLAERGVVRNVKPFHVGVTWIGGQYFVRKHPLFQDLPVNTALNWPYQDLVQGGFDRTALSMDGEELVAGAWQSTPFQLGTAVGVVKYGKGRVIFSTLSMVDALHAEDKASNVAKKLFCNFLQYAATP